MFPLALDKTLCRQDSPFCWLLTDALATHLLAATQHLYVPSVARLASLITLLAETLGQRICNIKPIPAGPTVSVARDVETSVISKSAPIPNISLPMREPCATADHDAR
jgi:hypothetical protein